MDLLVRTGGERRISNFLLWQAAYAEFYFTDTLWPDFDGEAFDDALAWYVGRERRFGMTSEQLRKPAEAHFKLAKAEFPDEVLRCRCFCRPFI